MKRTTAQTSSQKQGFGSADQGHDPTKDAAAELSHGAQKKAGFLANAEQRQKKKRCDAPAPQRFNGS
ncbi:MAG TPA: hypothetical protein PKM78_15375 [Anaerolineae bacterium]|nr:hypothetical protein [Anaerolineae bacterium]HNU05446.1 hypothetical protein [Anaerolineae bacterium]